MNRLILSDNEINPIKLRFFLSHLRAPTEPEAPVPAKKLSKVDIKKLRKRVSSLKRQISKIKKKKNTKRKKK
ncbi:hypothetical protein CMO89_00545 [Candidatus Woesearchaeota archaeon]|jgi:hypothetical protein|nr:hypothetical protein [Candidatus Woesearchaeota archaeon]|tara:strand:- start:20558 stop:20773 length:216 start_codon:yes stop_codon:yes gene_type:complete